MRKNDDTMETKLWYYTENYGTLIYYGHHSFGIMENTVILFLTFVNYSIL